jgi:hypothetical protein
MFEASFSKRPTRGTYRECIVVLKLPWISCSDPQGGLRLHETVNDIAEQLELR